VTSARPAPPVRRIAPSRGWTPLDLRELWEYHEVLYFLIWRTIKVRYKQTALGATWAVLQPLLTMLVFSVVFGRLVRVPSEGVPYPVFVFAALVPWTYFANALGNASNSLVEHERLLTKVYFPRVLLPAAAVLAGLLDLAIALAVLLVMMVAYGLTPAALWPLPFFVLLATLTAFGVGLWLAAWNIQYRDVRQLVPFLTQVWLYASPIVYASSLVPERWRRLYDLNPMAGVVNGFRWALLGGIQAPGPALWVSALLVALVLAGGLYHFRRAERIFADVA
jgi:lipopolysaccharide transport system permease protein